LFGMTDYRRREMTAYAYTLAKEYDWSKIADTYASVLREVVHDERGAK